MQRAPDGDALLFTVVGDGAVVFDVEMLLRAGAVFAFNDVSGTGPRGVYIAFFEEEAFQQVVLAPYDRGSGVRFLRW